MRTPSVKYSTEKLRGLSTYTCAKLSAKAETKDLAVLLEASEMELALADEGWRGAERNALVQQALRDQADEEADHGIRIILNTTRSLDGTSGGKGGPRQQRLFPKGLLGVTAVPIAAQPAAMTLFAGLLAEEEDASLTAFAATVTAAGQKLEAGVEAFAAANQAVTIASSQVKRARAAWIRLYEKVYGELVSRIGKRAAEPYFKAPKKLPTPKDPVLPTPTL
ncbi:MAG: hypothetical protein JRH20_27435 [Deltaproteobacteria bacterium]|nr:hypothetical protein [Deltaproteobacteria bacterium]